METNELHAAFEILLEEIEAVVSAFRESGPEAFSTGEYEGACHGIEWVTYLPDTFARLYPASTCEKRFAEGLIARRTSWGL